MKKLFLTTWTLIAIFGLFLTITGCYEAEELPEETLIEMTDMIDFYVHRSNIHNYNQDQTRADFWSSWKIRFNNLPKEVENGFSKIYIENASGESYEYDYEHGVAPEDQTEFLAGNVKRIKNGGEACYSFYLKGQHQDELRFIETNCVVVSW